MPSSLTLVNLKHSFCHKEEKGPQTRLAGEGMLHRKSLEMQSGICKQT